MPLQENCLKKWYTRPRKGQMIQLNTTRAERKKLSKKYINPKTFILKILEQQKSISQYLETERQEHYTKHNLGSYKIRPTNRKYQKGAYFAPRKKLQL